MDTSNQAAFVLQVVLALGPLAVYFLGLGLVNSGAHPSLVPARTDFVLLTMALIPMIMGPVVGLVEIGGWWPALAAGAVLAGFFIATLPRRDAAWVVYNCSLPQCRRLLSHACRRLGWAIEGGDDQLHIPEANLTITLSSLPLLRNVTLSFGRRGERGTSLASLAQLIDSLEREIRQEAILPSPTGASMVVIGACLLAVPMWFFFHNMDVIVRAVRQIFFA
jgi:hypothetical protein